MGANPGDEHVWLKDQVNRFEQRHPSYALLAEFLEAVLKKAAKPICPSSIVQARAKDVESFGRKILRWREAALRDGERVPDFAEELHDICGAPGHDRPGPRDLI